MNASKGLIVAVTVAVFAVAGCSGEKGGGSSGGDGATARGAKIACMNTANTCTSTSAAAVPTIRGLLAWLPEFVPAAHAEIQTIVTSFQGADLLSGMTAMIGMVVENVGAGIYTGYLYTDLQSVFGICGLAGGPLSLPPGESFANAFGCAVLNKYMPPGSYALSAYVFNTTANTGDPCDFTVDDSNTWTIVQVRDWFHTCAPTPAAIGTLQFNVIVL